MMLANRIPPNSVSHAKRLLQFLTRRKTTL